MSYKERLISQIFRLLALVETPANQSLSRLRACLMLSETKFNQSPREIGGKFTTNYVFGQKGNFESSRI